MSGTGESEKSPLRPMIGVNDLERLCRAVGELLTQLRIRQSEKRDGLCSVCGCTWMAAKRECLNLNCPTHNVERTLGRVFFGTP